MPTSIITTGTTDDVSADITLAAGTPTTISLRDAAGPVLDSQCRAVIQVKTSDGQYMSADGGMLTGVAPQKVIDGPGTFRVQKFAGPSFGVDRD